MTTPVIITVARRGRSDGIGKNPKEVKKMDDSTADANRRLAAARELNSLATVDKVLSSKNKRT
jgi:hypothetical protein